MTLNLDTLRRELLFAKRRDKSGEMQDITTWFRITLWNKQAENASKYLQKGKPVYIEGRLKLDEWTDRDGNTRQTLDVTATEMQFIGSGARSEEMSASAGSSGSANEFSNAPTEDSQQSGGSGEGNEPSEDEIPF